MYDLNRQKPVLRNWQAMIYHKIDNSRLDVRSVVEAIEEDIDKCYCMEFANDEEYVNMLDYLVTSKKRYIAEVDQKHKIRMAEIRQYQAELLRQEETKKLLIDADREYTQKFGRVMKT